MRLNAIQSEYIFYFLRNIRIISIFQLLLHMKLKHAIIVFLALTSALSSAATIVRETESGGIGNPSFWTDNYTTTNNVLPGSTQSRSGNAADTGMGTFQNTGDGSGDFTQLTNGISPIVAGVKTNFAVARGGDQIVFSFLTATALSSIQYYGGWVDNGRSDTQFNVSYSINNGTNYTLLSDPAATFSVFGNAGQQNQPVSGNSDYVAGRTFSKDIGGGPPVANFVSITDSTGQIGEGALITDLKFDFFNGTNNYQGVMELAAYAVPEPSVCLLGFGAIALLARRKR